VISFRGIAAIAIGAMFFYFMTHPELIGSDPPPLWLRVIFILAGAALIAAGIYSTHFVWKRYGLMHSVRPIKGEVSITSDKSSDTASCTLDVFLGHGHWKMDADPAHSIQQLAEGIRHPALVWCDPRTGAPFGLKINGTHVNTLAAGKRQRSG